MAERENQKPPSVIHSDPETMSGQPVFRGTRIPFQVLLDYIKFEPGGGKQGFEEFLLGFPQISREQAMAALAEHNLLHLIQ